jgi:serine/threonine protein kinase
MPTNWQIGDKIENRWEIHKILGGAGKSGMGIVYVVYDHEWKEPFAAKTFQDEVFAEDPAAADRFKHEALAWIGLDLHQNVTQAEFVQNIGGKPFLFLEYVSGGDLSSLIGTPRLTKDLPQVLRLCIQFCDGMIHALSKGIKAHRDIKPQNCLITEDNVLKVTDFGLAKVFDAMELESSTASSSRSEDLNILVSRTGSAAGTPPYMAPEQFDDVKHVDVRADIYSFGVMLFEMLEGRWPFVARSFPDFRRLHKSESPPVLTSVDANVRDLVERCLAKDPAQRPSNFGELRCVLERAYARKTGAPAPKAISGAQLDAFRLNNKGSSFANLGRLDQALSCYDQALEFDPHYETSLIGKGAVMESLGRIEDATKFYNQALEINPCNAVAWSNKGNALSVNRDYEEAISSFDRAIELRPLYASAWLNKGAVLARLDRDSEALFCMERALEIDPRDADAWSNKASCLGSLGRYTEAFFSFQQAIAINPRLEKAWFNQGLLFGLIGNMEEALRCFEKTLGIAPANKEGWFYEGRTLASLGQLDRALHCFERAGELGHPEASEYIRLCKTSLTDQDAL